MISTPLPTGCYFITGIDTNIGKSYATGYLASNLLAQGRHVITQKLIETGSRGISADICTHRMMMGTGLLPEDISKLTMPMQLSYPASPHLASRLDNTIIDIAALSASTKQLADRYDIVLIEGAGGLCVPLHDEGLLLVDYIRQQKYPVILVTSGRLGSINHTLMSLQILSQYGMPLYALIYNTIHNHQDELIAHDTQRFLQDYLTKNFAHAHFWQLPLLGEYG